MANGALIPVVLPNYNVASDGASIGFGHAAFILVLSDGSATYYEYGLYANSAQNAPFLAAVNPNGAGAVRRLPLEGLCNLIHKET